MIKKLLSMVFLSIVFTNTSYSMVDSGNEFRSDHANLPIAILENQHLRIQFERIYRDGQESARPVVEINNGDRWVTVPLNEHEESYQIISNAGTPPLNIYRWSHRWESVKSGQERTQLIWEAGSQQEAVIRDVKQVSEHSVSIDFYPMPSGDLQAQWELRPGDETVKVSLEFIPSESGQYSLGYFVFNSSSISEVDELLMPPTVNRKRFPKESKTILQGQQPTPLSLAQTSLNGNPITWGISADPSEVPFEFPTPIESQFGMHIRNQRGQVQPSIFGPLLGTPLAETAAGDTVDFSFRVFVRQGDWYNSYRYVADTLFNWRDYRENGEVSLTQSVLNMIELYKDDKYGGWWKHAKAHYQIESKNGSTHASPLTPLSLYHLTGDSLIYKERVLPTLEFVLSRSNQHFSPEPQNTGGYPAGSMDGPVGIYGTTVYSGLWQMTNYLTPRLKDIALPQNGINGSSGASRPFDDWLGRYQLTGEEEALKKAINQADRYIEQSIEQPPTEVRPYTNFFLISYIPKWQSLLNLYEETGKERFLDAATFGAKMLMTGIWTQPTPPDGQITIHPDGQINGDKMERKLHKADKLYRLGWPIEEQGINERKVPSWLVSNVGLGLEQPSTYTYEDQGGRMILQANWAPAFLRLARYTGHEQYRTYARNAVIGRWGNYPGYYYTTFTDLIQDPEYPYEGPDIGFIYYHHLPVHLSWTIDYLVSEAQLRSEGAVSFPGTRQFGYAFFDYLTYGNEPGKVMNNEDVWLWMDEDLVSLDNPQINYLTAHTNDRFFLILMNESKQDEEVEIKFNPSEISPSTGDFTSAEEITGSSETIQINGNRGSIIMEPRGFKVVEIDDLKIDVPVHQEYQKPERSAVSGFTTAKVSGEPGEEIRAATIQVKPGEWQAYVWSTAESKSLEEISLSWRAGGQKGTIKDRDYPYEFSVPVSAEDSRFYYKVNGTRADGTSFSTKEYMIGVGD